MSRTKSLMELPNEVDDFFHENPEGIFLTFDWFEAEAVASKTGKSMNAVWFLPDENQHEEAYFMWAVNRTLQSGEGDYFQEETILIGDNEDDGWYWFSQTGRDKALGSAVAYRDRWF